MNVDHSNSHSSFKDTIYMSNLCQEITLPTKPLQHIDDEKGEIALCILSAVNIGLIKDNNELEDLCDTAVRALEEIIDYQKQVTELFNNGDELSIKEITSLLKISSAEPIFFIIRQMCFGNDDYLINGDWSNPSTIKIKKII